MTANPVRPARYRAGKPLPGDRSEDSGDEDDEENEEEDDDGAEEVEQKQQAAPVHRPAQAGTIISTGLQKVDLNQTFQKRSDDEESSEDEDESEDDEKEDDEDAQGDYLKPSRPAPSGDYESSGSDDSSDEDSSSEDETSKRRKLIRPTFIPKSKRNLPEPTTTIADSTSAAAIAQRKAEAHNLVESAIRREAVENNARSKKSLDADVTYTEPPDDTDDLDPAAERAAWKLRELLRIKRARDAIETMEKEREEIEARRAMDTDERLKSDLEFVAKQRQEAQDKKGKMGFMQKFYHKGAFYQDDESEVMTRSYATAKVEDRVVNLDVLPKALQVRSLDQLGKRGRTKWTHLAAEDTTSLGREEGYGFAGQAMRKPKKFEDLKGVRDERFMSDREREKRGAAERGDTDTRNSGGGEIGRGVLEETATMIERTKTTTPDVMVGDQITIEKTVAMVTKEGPHINPGGMTERTENEAAMMTTSMRSGGRLILNV
ncbi:hypothetical protein TWF191_008365 [Orbilia oligospora]|uniref:Micro-fibrillar-associated protein 1 C-terminal domain-containing protein n=1 Tax=Orbilia oligospora TaxID=2813651 RepID=A0A7C8QNC9_ORBOL|nr:hypothetical protein TWF191_008365 [Orbilia oligospora]